MDGRILGPAALDDYPEPGQTVSHADKQYNGREVSIEGSVTVLLDHHAPRHISRPQLRANVADYTWFDEGDGYVLRHRFNNQLRNHHVWRDDETRTPWTIDFDMGVISASEVQCSREAHSPHRNYMLSYIFTHAADYQRFQTMFRSKDFLRDYDIKSIDCDRSNTLKQKDQCIKSWRSNGKLSLTIPVSVRSTGSGPAWKIEHVEIMATWMEWQPSKLKSVKATYKKASRRPSLAQDWARNHGPSFIRRRSSHPVSSISDAEETTTAESSFMKKWPSFVIEFHNSAVRDLFLQQITGASIPSTPASPLSVLTTGTSLPPESSESTSFINRTPPATPITEPSSPQIPSDIKKEFESSGSDSDDLESTEMGDSSFNLLRDNYLRVGGPHVPPRVISASQSQVYKKLANIEDEVRILKIAGGKRKDSLCCSLIYESLATAPKYEALSYCWGTEEATRAIPEGNLKGFLVTEHLWRALVRLRMETEDRLVWIDALCINQQDVDERNHQLALMRKIYAKALRTIIWIGDFQPSRKSCKRAFPDEGDSGLTLCVKPGLAETEHDNAVEDLRNDLHCLQTQHNPDGKSDVWWRRLWCIQEFHFSANKPSVYLGPHAVKWEHFYSLFETDNNPLQTFEQLRAKTPRTLCQLVALTGPFNSSDPRDRIFALLGMAPAAGIAIPPDYHHSVIRVIEEAVMYLIQETSTLDILLDERPTRLAWGKAQLVGVMPSWIPDLTCLLKTGCMFDSKTDDAFESHKYNAGLPRGQSPTKPSITLSPATTRPSIDDTTVYDEPRTMHCHAWHFDIIEKRTTVATLPGYEQSPNGYLIYNSRQIRGNIIDWILNSLEYDFNGLNKSKKRTKLDLDSNPRIGLLLLDYLLEGQRSHVEEFKNRLKPPERNVIRSYEHQRNEDIKYIGEETGEPGGVANADIEYITKRWELKIAREENNQRFIPARLQPALDTKKKSFQEDFEVARELGNLYAYARGTRERYYLNKSNFDAPMRKDVLGCPNIAEVRALGTQFTAGDIDIEFHEYNAKSRERDFFKTKAGFLGLGPACMEVGDKIVVPLGASRPFVLREDTEQGGFYTLVGEAVVPSIMSGKLATLEKDSFQEFKIK